MIKLSLPKSLIHTVPLYPGSLLFNIGQVGAKFLSRPSFFFFHSLLKSKIFEIKNRNGKNSREGDSFNNNFKTIFRRLKDCDAEKRK